MPRRPDGLTLELATVLCADEWFEFKPLFLLVRSNLRSRNVGCGDAEMLRLRAYEKLHNLVQQGIVEKSGKAYKGVTKTVTEFSEKLATEHAAFVARQAAKEIEPPALAS